MNQISLSLMVWSLKQNSDIENIWCTEKNSIMPRRGKNTIQGKNTIHGSSEASIDSVVSFWNIPFCPIATAALGACAKALSNAAFHSNRSSEVSA